ncbi:MAG: hypothetical protein M1347_05530 [Chloroflexi bacterium]|nr:hypothetical protein [Chloroflexota bacterium]
MNWNNLQGELPPELGNLSQLRTLVLYFNELGGSLPVELGELAKLEVLILHNNCFEGGIPAEFCGMQSLQKLDLENSCLSGSLPGELGQLFQTYISVELAALPRTGLEFLAPPDEQNKEVKIDDNKKGS